MYGFVVLRMLQRRYVNFVLFEFEEFTLWLGGGGGGWGGGALMMFGCGLMHPI